MATIDSLDLASLQNNPEDIAEALEDVLETTSGNIGTLKTSAQTDHDTIEGLLTSAQADHDAIEAILDGIPDFSVVDRTSIFDIASSDFSFTALQAYSFNNFMFVTWMGTHSGVPDTVEEVMHINSSDSDYWPASLTIMPTVSYKGDTAERLKFNTDGTITIEYATEEGGDSIWYMSCNGWYRF